VKSATPTDEEIRRRLERQVTDDVLDRLTLGASPRDVVQALTADGFDHAAATAYVDRVVHSPEGRAARSVARPGGRCASFILVGVLAGLVAGLGIGGAVPMALLGGAIGWLVFAIRKDRRDGGAGVPGFVPAMPWPTASSLSAIPSRPDDAVGLFLREALQRRLIDLATFERLDRFRPGVEPPAPVLTGPTSVTPPGAPTVADAIKQAPPPSPVAVRPPATAPDVVRGPSAFELRVRSLRELVVSDIAVHGLTYLGALLLFAGAFGFVLFSFGSVRVGLRPVAELGVPSLLLASAWYLRRRGAPFVATALGLVGGVLLPIFLFGSFVDSVAIPPDLSGTPLLVTLVLVSLATAAGYALYARRVPGASVGFLVVPTLWLAAWSAGLAFNRLPDGTFSLQRWSAPQLAVVAVAIAISAAAARMRPDARLAEVTRPVIVPGIAIAYGLVVAIAAGDGWPAAPVVVAGLAALVVSEAVRGPAGVIAVAQPLVLGLTLLALGPALGVAWTGALGVALFLGLSEVQLRRRPGVVGAAMAAAGIVLGLAAASAEAWPAVAAFGVASLWSHVRRMRPASLEPAGHVPLLVAATTLPIGVGAGLVAALPDDIAAIAIAVLVALAAMAVRLWAPRDDFSALWLPAAAAAALLVSFSPTVGPTAAAAAAGLVAIAFVAAPALFALRVWGGAVAMGWGVWSAAAAVGLDPSSRTLLLAASGAVLAAASGLLRRPLDAHMGGAGVVGAMTALLMSPLGQVSSGGWTRTGVLASAVASFVATAWWSEARGIGPVGTIAGWLSAHDRDRLAGTIRAVPIVAVAIGAPVLAVDLAGIAGLTRRSWNGIVLSSVGLAEAATARLLAGRRPEGDAAAVAAFATTAIGISVAVPDPWATIVTLAVLVAATWVLGGSLRRSAMTWIAWAASAALVILLVGRAGVAARDLWIPAFAWGAIALIGGLLVDEIRNGPRASGDGVRSPWLWPPVALGALVVPAALAFAFTGSPLWYGRWSVAAAVLYLIVARQLRAGSIATASFTLVTVSAVALSGVSIIDQPLLLVPWSAGLVAVSEIVRRSSPQRDPWTRWDIGPIVVGLGTAVTALALAVPAGEVAPVWASCGLVAIALGAVRRSVLWSLGGATLVFVAAAEAGPGWLALACAAVTVAAIVAATRTTPPLRHVLQGVAAVAAGAAWWSFLAWAAWPLAWAAVTTACVGTVLLLGPAVALRLRRLAEGWTFAAWSVGASAVAAAVVLATSSNSGMTTREIGLLGSGALAVVSLAIGLAASRLELPSQRETATGIAILAACQLGIALDVPAVPAAVVAATTGLIAIGAWIALWRVRPRSPWIPSVIVVAIVGDVASLLLAASVLPRGDLLEVALLLSGLECATAGVILGRTHLVAISPLFAAAAWLVYASEAFRGQVQWFTVPSGIALLALVTIERRGRQRAGMPLRTPELLAIEYTGMASIVVVALIEIVTVSPLHGFLAIGWGIGLGAWGGLTQVRRRGAVGAGVVALAVLLLLAVPIAELFPTMRGPALWLVLTGAGLVFILVATMLERGRTKVREVLRRLDDLTQGWE
jgi:hypothetical protein